MKPQPNPFEGMAIPEDCRRAVETLNQVGELYAKAIQRSVAEIDEVFRGVAFPDPYGGPR